MTWEKEITVEGNVFQVTISDNQTVLLSAYAKGRTVIGLWDRNKKNISLHPARYIVESLNDIDDVFLERVVRRRMHMPWKIAETDRLLIREFVPEDCVHVPCEPDGGKNSQLFWQEETLKEYIQCQYEFYEYGVWAVEEKKTGNLVGKAGIWNLELSEIKIKTDTPIEMGYHIFSTYRRQGYGKEVCQAILSYTASHVSDSVYVTINEKNLPSVSLARNLGFRLAGQTHSESDSNTCLYEWNCT
jgi:RimJ/RimL family protein N-acetyltransferase